MEDGNSAVELRQALIAQLGTIIDGWPAKDIEALASLPEGQVAAVVTAALQRLAGQSNQLLTYWSDLEISGRLRDELRNMGVHQVFELTEMTASEFLRGSGRPPGRKSVNEARDLLSEMGLGFKPH